jgi:hypothetical protein
VFKSYHTGTHEVTEPTTDRPGNPGADVRCQLTIDITGDAVVHIHSNVRFFASGKTKVYVYGNAHGYAGCEAEIFFMGEGRLDIEGHAVAHVSASVFTVASGYAHIEALEGGRVLAYGEVFVEAGAETEVTRRGRATVKRGSIVEGPESTYRGGYLVYR